MLPSRPKILHLSPMMTVSELKHQIQQLIGCDMEIYVQHRPAPPYLTLQEIGFHLPAYANEVLQLAIDETWRIRELEAWFEQHCQLQVELGKSTLASFRNKQIRIYQLRHAR